MGYQIKTIASMLGIPRNTLLAWERRHNVVRPSRLANGYREYSEADLERLRSLKHLLDNGHRLSEALSLLDKPGPALPDSLSSVREQVLEALLQLDRERAMQLILRGVSLSYSRQLDTLYFPLLKTVGEQWLAGQLSVAQEHFVSHFCREQITAMLLRLGHGPEHGPRVLCAVYPDDPHDIPLLGVSVKLAMRGYRVLFLGASTPLDALLEMIREHKPQKVCISVILPAPASALVQFAQSLQAAGPGDIEFGGAGLPKTGLVAMPRVRWVR
jgi:DNA-binding transcriptional MerR regulator/methylmalonyl-CoA mutase cobalamin-binding subunit